MGKRFFDFCKNGPQILKKIAIHSSFGFLEPFSGEKIKKRKIDPQNFFGPPSQRKRAKKQQKQPKMTLFGPKMAIKG